MPVTNAQDMAKAGSLINSDGTTVSVAADLLIADKLVHTGDTNTAIRFPAADTVTVETSGTERMRIDSSGRVGIGTSSPDATLQVVRATSQTDIDGVNQVATFLNTSSDTSGNLTGIRLRQDNVTNTAQGFIGLSSTGNSATRANLVIATPNTSGNSTERLRIDSSGNVGIGTTSPSAKLHVSGGSTSSIRNESTGTTINEYSQTINYAGNGAYLVQNLVYGNGLCVTAANPAVGQLYQIGTTSSTPVQFITNNIERLRIDSSGRVSIGTSAARTQLEVSGVVSSSGTANGFQIYARSTNENSAILYSQQVGDFRIYDASSGLDRFKLDTNGDCLVVSNARIGYGAGSGGTVTQGTSKTTGVTLNKPTGQITMHNAALANGASVNFALTNSFISAVDTLLVNATAFGGYTVLCVNTATGAATIRVTNISGGSLSEAVTIQFAVIRGAAA